MTNNLVNQEIENYEYYIKSKQFISELSKNRKEIQSEIIAKNLVTDEELKQKEQKKQQSIVKKIKDANSELKIINQNY
ncbi:hypothetical protein IMG5_190320, partial [Ichthyophthirius multifiliis]